MDQNSKILVSGATGFLGNYLVRLLIQKGYQVRGLKRPTSQLGQLECFTSERLEWFDADVTDIVALEDAFKGITHVCHCAALVSFHPKDIRAMQRINVVGTANMVNLCLDFNIKKFIHISSIAALGRTKTRLQLDEKCPWVQSKDNSNYALTKHLSEQEVWRAAAEGLNVTIVAPSVIVGSSSWEQGMAGFFKKIDKGLKVYPSGGSGFVDVRDVALFVEKMLCLENSNERYILNAVNLKHKDFFTMIAQSLNKPAPAIQIGPILAEIAWRVEWIKEKILGTLPIATKESARASVTNYQYLNQKSLTVPGFKYRPFEQTISDTAAQYLTAKLDRFKPMTLEF